MRALRASGAFPRQLRARQQCRSLAAAASVSFSESALADRSLLRRHAYVDGRWAEAASGASFAVADPATGLEVARVPDMSAADVRVAVEAAARAGGEWRARTAKVRGDLLRRWRDLMLANVDDLARIMTAECGKPLAESRGEVGYAAAFLEWYADEGRRAYGDIIPTGAANRRLLAMRQPVGVCALITPWNFPAAMITRKVGPALAAGCTVVIKPSEDAPLSSLALLELAQRAGIPAGVVNVVTCSRANADAVGGELTGSALVRKISFTGSTAVGKRLYGQCAGTVKRMSLELGGNAPFIVFDDANLGAAVEGAMASKFRNTGQTCVCANRFIVQAGVYDEFSRRLAARVAALRVGPGLLPGGVDQGPLINAAAAQRVAGLVQAAVAGGALALTGGSALPDRGPLFYAPTVLTNVQPSMRVAREEIFGPIAPILRFDTEAEAVALANDTPSGLAGCVNE